MIVQIPTIYALVNHQIEKYTELLTAARMTDDIKRRSFLRQQLFNLKIQKQSLLN